jgi:uncharacterized membrane protein YtjA (UPF0391 family)
MKRSTKSLSGGTDMRHYAVIFLVSALLAAYFGFGGIAVSAAVIAKCIFIVFLIGALVALFMSAQPVVSFLRSLDSRAHR